MRIVATADLHGNFPEIKECDLLLIAGDVCPVWGSHDIKTQSKWLFSTYKEWLDKVPAKEIVWIAGNHDFVCEQEDFKEQSKELNATYLQDELYTTKGGYSIWGSPWVPRLKNWAFYSTPAEFYKRAEIMPKADCYLLHGPPYGILDQLAVSREHVGADHVCIPIYEHSIKNVVFGHIHEAYGLEKRNGTTFRNVAYNNEYYEPINFPHVFDVLV